MRRIAASAKRPVDIGQAGNGGFISTTLGRIAGSRWSLDLLGVLLAPADHGIVEQAAEQPGAGVGDLVQGEPRFRQFGEDREQAGAGRRFEHEIDRGRRCRLGGNKAKRNRRRELLEVLGFLQAAHLRREPSGEACQARRSPVAIASPCRICAGTIPVQLRVPRRRPSTPTPLRRRCHRRRLPRRSLGTRGCQSVRPPDRVRGRPCPNTCVSRVAAWIRPVALSGGLCGRNSGEGGRRRAGGRTSGRTPRAGFRRARPGALFLRPGSPARGCAFPLRCCQQNAAMGPYGGEPRFGSFQYWPMR